MKKIVLALALMLATFAASASNTLYFTYNQALRTVTLLNNQDELMIYCGYADELPTYVLLNEVWAEQISSSFYEVWLYGYDAYTGEEVYMPIDLECIWLVHRGHIYSAAQTLRFRTSHARPTFAWQMPRYNPFVRAPRPATFYYTYHYDIHRPGWHYSHHPHVHYHPYYMRHPHHPAPMPPAPFTPGHDKPGYKTHQGANGEIGYEYIPTNTTGNITASRSQTIVQNDPSSRTGNRITSDRGKNTVTTTDRISGTRSTVNAPEVNNGRGSDNGRGTSTGTRANDNSRGTSTGTRSNDNSRGTSTGTRANDNSRGTSTGTRSNDNSRGTSTGTRSNDNSRGTSTGTRSGDSKKSTATTTESNSRGTSTDTRSNDRQKSSTTTTETNSRGTSTGTRSNDNSRGTSTGTRSSDNSRGTSTGTRTTSTNQRSATESGASSRGTSTGTRR